MSAAFLIACGVLFVVPISFVVHKVYDDGLVGRIGLLGVSFSAALFLLHALAGALDDKVEKLPVPPGMVLMACCFAIFLVWHLFRFHRRVLLHRRVLGKVYGPTARP